MESPGYAGPASEDSPEGEALQSELRAEIEKAIMSVPADQRTTLVMVDVQGLSYQEAAEAMGVSMGTVKSRMSRARAKVRDLLLENRELLPEQFRQY